MMRAMQDAARLAGVLADPARLAILGALLERPATVTDLASRLDLPQPRVSTHLARLRTAGLVSSVSTGRHRAYQANEPRANRLLGALTLAGSTASGRTSARAGRERRRDTPLRHARTCYDHLAGVEGVRLLRAMRRRKWLRDGLRSDQALELTGSGARALARRGVDVDAARAARRQFAAPCLDWTEREPHLSGALGA